jgi:ATP-dependent DNA helicase RecQ
MPGHSIDDLKKVIEKHWGYRTLRPLQEPAMRAALEGRDSLVVMPTGGGKSLCYQAPAVLVGGTTVVISPLIALMKDQVDGLKINGVSALQLDSSLTSEERAAHFEEIRRGNVRLLFISPERMALADFRSFLVRLDVRTFAIDEAHCISHWGHDFRPEYRQLRELRDIFPKASIHAFTATATQRVQHDIAQQLRLREPALLVGNFDRPNLNYRITPREDEEAQVIELLRRHSHEAGIIYCIRRLEVDALAATLKSRGFNVMPYHAGMTAQERKAAQDAFIAEDCDVIVATVAFGMGIDRSNLRFVMHTGMPKSIEHYQQETGRAGRDGLEAECALLFAMKDFMTWKYLIEKSAGEHDADPQYVSSAMQHLRDMQRYCEGMVCRHKALVEYFGQKYDAPTCQACDVCLGETEPVPDADVIAQKILSCVARVEERFGVNHVVDVLRGGNTEKVRSFKHDQLSTYGLLKECTQVQVRNWIYQLLGQGLLMQEGERPVLQLNEASWDVLRKKRGVRLRQPLQRKTEAPTVSRTRTEAESWEGVDRGLFEELRALRQQLAKQENVPPYVVFNDRTLREMARQRPSTPQRMRAIHGVGEKKLSDWGDPFIAAIVKYCQSQGIALDRSDTHVDDFEADDEDGAYESLGPGLKPKPRKAYVPLPRTDPVADSQAVARKILSCVARVKNRYRSGHIVRILRGRPSDAVTRLEHDKLSTYGLLSDHSAHQVRDWIAQLIAQQLLEGEDEYNPLLSLNDASWEVLRNQRQASLLQAPAKKRDAAPADFWDGVDAALFEALTLERTRLAADRKLAPTAMLQDFVLREMARVRPSSLDKMRLLSGISDTKLNDVGSNFLGVIALHCEQRKLARDVAVPAPTTSFEPQLVARPGSTPYRAFQLFREGASIDEVMAETNKVSGTVHNYLHDFILREKPASIGLWVSDELYAQVAAAIAKVGVGRLKPIFLALDEKVPYEVIKLVVAHLGATKRE